MRDYKLKPVVWDKRPNCKHAWIDHEAALVHENRNNIRGTQEEARHARKTSYIVKYDKSKASFCMKCGAWRGQLGLEPTFDLYIEHLCGIFDEVKRVLRKTGSCWINMGDTYGGSWGAMSHDMRKKARRIGYNGRPPSSNFKPKCLAQIPSRFAIEMCNRGWILRNEIIWHKPNCMPSSAKDRFTVDFEKVFFFVKSRRYYFEQQFDPYEGPINRWGGQVIKSNTEKQKQYFEAQKISRTSSLRTGGDCRPNLEGRNKRCVWKIPTQQFPGAHFAVYPEALVQTPIKAGCPEFVCRECGKPRQKIFETKFVMQEDVSPEKNKKSSNKGLDASNGWGKYPRGRNKYSFKGYYDCGCSRGWDRGIVLDPFSGSGTTCLVAKKLGRRWIGIDINPGYCRMARGRLARSD